MNLSMVHGIGLVKLLVGDQQRVVAKMPSSKSRTEFLMILRTAGGSERLDQLLSLLCVRDRG